jgi:nicotinamidase/pyrazinamidase
MESDMNKKYGVIVTDIQGCFTTWKNGSLAVPGTDEAYVKSVEAATRRLKKEGFFIVATQDWHPSDHVSFASNHPGKVPFDTVEVSGRTQVLWPVHCVQDTEDARLLIDNSLFETVVRKAQDPRFDSYSAVKDDSGAKTGLEAILRQHGVTSTVIYGIATDYCVKATAIDLVLAGFKVVAVEQLCRGVTTEISGQALELMQAQGVRVVKDLDVHEIKSLM